MSVWEKPTHHASGYNDLLFGGKYKLIIFLSLRGYKHASHSFIIVKYYLLCQSMRVDLKISCFTYSILQERGLGGTPSQRFWVNVKSDSTITDKFSAIKARNLLQPNLLESFCDWVDIYTPIISIRYLQRSAVCRECILVIRNAKFMANFIEIRGSEFAALLVIRKSIFPAPRVVANGIDPEFVVAFGSTDPGFNT